MQLTTMHRSGPAHMQISVSVMSSKVTPPEELERKAAAVKRFVQQRFGFEPVQESRAYITYQIGRDREAVLPELLAQLEEQQEALGITDLQVRRRGVVCPLVAGVCGAQCGGTVLRWSSVWCLR